MSGLGSTALKAGAALGAAFAAKAALDFAKSSIAAFSNLEESVNAVNVVYGEAAEGVLELGEDSVEQFGLSTRAVNDAAVSLGAFVDKIDAADPADAFGNVIQRATDFASVMNITTAEALDKFRAGLSGESEPLKRFGINVSEANVKLFALESGLIASGEQMDEATKIQARFGFIMQETEKTAGDFANTSDGLAGLNKKLAAQWEEMQATIGEELEPAMIRLLDVATKLIPILGKLGGVVGGVVDEAIPLIDLVATLADQLGDFSEASEEGGESAGVMQLAMEGLFNVFTLGPLRDITQGMIETADEMLNTADAAGGLQVAFDGFDPSGLSANLAALGSTLGGVTTLQEAAISPTANYNRVVGAAAASAASAAAAEERRAAGIRAVLSAQAEAASPALRLLRAQQGVLNAQERLEEIRGDPKLKDDTAEAVLSLLDAQAGLEGATANISGRVGDSVAAVEELGTTAGATTEEMVLLLELFGLFPTSINVDFNFRVRGQQSIGEVLQILRDPGTSALVNLDPEVRRLIGRGKRHGGPVAADEPFIVGESGPELFIPDRAGRIIPNKAFGDQSIVVNVNDPTTTDLSADLSAGLIAAQITQQVELLRT